MATVYLADDLKHDRKTFFYRDGVHIVAAAVGANPGFVVTSRRDFADDQFAANYDVMPDGKHLPVLVPDERDAESQSSRTGGRSWSGGSPHRFDSKAAEICRRVTARGEAVRALMCARGRSADS